jgi:hypothetical protein
MKNLWGPEHMPPKELVEYWRAMLDLWLEEYSDGCKGGLGTYLGDTALDTFTAKPGTIVQLDVPGVSGKELAVVLVSRRADDGDDGAPRWLFCPISNYLVPATMWEFYVNASKTGRIVVEAWNIGTVLEEELFKVAKPVDRDDIVSDADVEKISHAFGRMLNTEFQDIPMMEVGPRVFLLSDPRRNYQRDEKVAYDFLRKLGAKSKGESVEDAVREISDRA